MGKSKFPGKPSKSVPKERVRVLNKKNVFETRSFDHEKKSGCFVYNECHPNLTSINLKERQSITQSRTDVSPEDPTNLVASPNELGDLNARKVELCSQEPLKQNELKSASTETPAALDDNGTNNCKNENAKNPLTEMEKNLKKKTVTFKNILETSDDSVVIKKIYNPVSKGPLVSIMKKECSTSHDYTPRGESIVRPSRLTEILINNENIDKTKSLSFRSHKKTISNSESDNQFVFPNAKHCEPYSGENSLFSNNSRPQIDFQTRIGEVTETEKKECGERREQSNDKSQLFTLSDNIDIQDNQFKDDDRKPSSWAKDKVTFNKVVLREPRLVFEPQKEKPTKIKLNTVGNDSIINSTHTSCLSGCSLCGICKTAVNCKSLKNRKYGIIACDACRKFISKINKKTVSLSTNPAQIFKIQCIKRNGECVLTKAKTKSFRKICSERCSACWLKKCIETFHFPSGHKLRLGAILAESNKNDKSFSTDNLIKSKDAQKSSCHSYSDNNVENCRIVPASDDFAETVQTYQPFLDLRLTFDLVSKTKKPLFIKTSSKERLCAIDEEKPIFLNPALKKQKLMLPCENIEMIAASNNLSSTDYAKRQRVDFKGPRVKHVCRSASIALGQQIATFQDFEDESFKLSQQQKTEIETKPFANSMLENINFLNNEKEIARGKTEDFGAELKHRSEMLKQELALNVVKAQKPSFAKSFSRAEILQPHWLGKRPSLCAKKVPYEKNKCELRKQAQDYNKSKKLFMFARRNLSSLSKINLMRIEKPQKSESRSKIILINFWDAYFPAEINQNGFGLISTETTMACVLCFLCGSMDLDHLIFCASCCEPYHSYCVQEYVGSNTENKKDLFHQLNWVCPRCSVCHTCSMSSGAKITCRKCKKNYHSTCMGTSKGLHGADRPLICRNCLKCQSCSSTSVSKYVGNQPICTQCFENRKSASPCPLCNHFVENVLDLTILECSVCEKLIHAKCEGLTEEQSNLLSNVPGSIKFVCKKCSLTNENTQILAKEWREAVHEELKSGLLDILKLLSRSRHANLLKINQKAPKNCQCSRKSPNEALLSKDSSKINDVANNNGANKRVESECFCVNTLSQVERFKGRLSLLNIKMKIRNGEYFTLSDFDADMNDVIMPLKNDELILAYKEILSEKFSWFQNETKTCTDALEEDMFQSCSYSFQLDDSLTEDHNFQTKLPCSDSVSHPIKQDTDKRTCQLCQKTGDGEFCKESRLLYYGLNSWVHANCAIWSNEVYEEYDGTLLNLNDAVNKAKTTKCAVCKCYGATVKCAAKVCCSFYHFQCARKSDCIFTSDKSVYCSNHYNIDETNESLKIEKFSVPKPLYIDFDVTQKKYAEPSQIRYVVGSLSVIQLGTIHPKFSNTSEAIVPVNFVCNRLYWSTIEPWKIVKYNVRTVLQHGTVPFTDPREKHFTVDHSNCNRLVEMGLSQITSWHNTLMHENKTEVNLRSDYKDFGNLRLSTDNSDHNEINLDSSIEEEPQNNSDLLPPEIKDAIFEDLPHDILEGISMLDIFPKLMIYEDLITIEGKSDTMPSNEEIESSGQMSQDCSSCNSLNIQGVRSKYTFNTLNHMEDINTPVTYLRHEPQRNCSSDFLLRNLDGYQNQQISSSVTWRCKLDNTRKYFTNTLPDIGVCEARVLKTKYKSFEDETEDLKLKPRPKYGCEDTKRITKKEKCNLTQLDGADDDVLSLLGKSTVKCDRCQCTYRTFDSFQRHLPNCEQISTSESETETSPRSPEGGMQTVTVFQEEPNSNNLQVCNEALANSDFSTKISLINETNVISTEHIAPQIFYTNGRDKLAHSEVNHIGNKAFVRVNQNDPGVWQNICNTTKENKTVYSLTNSNNIMQLESFKPANIASRETINTINKTEHNPANYLQSVNQHFVQNNDYSPKDQQLQQQFLVIQQNVGNNNPYVLQQVANPTPPIQPSIYPIVLSNNSTQYASVPSNTNSMLQGPVFTSDTCGNLFLSSGLQMYPMPLMQMAPIATPQLFGTLNQPQPIQIGANQMLIGGGNPGMEMVPNSNQLFLGVPPVYYGLETIVQNTIMSSQQYVSTAIQGVLSQNSSFSATTTQVFQSSKFEPVCEAPTSYVLVNNADGTSSVMPQSNLLLNIINGNNVHDFQNNYSQDFVNVCGPHAKIPIQEARDFPLVPTKSDLTSIIVNRSNKPTATSFNVQSDTRQPDIRVCNTSSTFDNVSSSKCASVILLEEADIKDLNANATSNDQSECNTLALVNNSKGYQSQTRPCEVRNILSSNVVQAKQKKFPKPVNQSKKSKCTQISSKLQYKTNFPNKEAIKANKTQTVTLKGISRESNKPSYHALIKNNEQVNVYSQSVIQNEPKCNEDRTEGIHLNENDSNRCMVPKLNNRYVQPTCAINSSKKSLISASNSSNFNNVPTNVVAPILQMNSIGNTQSRPTNRVLPMQLVQKDVETPKIKNVATKRHLVTDNCSDFPEAFTEGAKNIQAVKASPNFVNDRHEVSINLKPEPKETNKSSRPLNEISEAINQETPKQTTPHLLENFPTLGDIHILNKTVTHCNNNASQSEHTSEHVLSVQNQKLKTDSLEKTNKNLIEENKNCKFSQVQSPKVQLKTKSLEESSEYLKSPSVQQSPDPHLSSSTTTTCNVRVSPQKNYENDDVNKDFEPHLIYEIRSEDGFCYKSKSIAVIWEKVFEAVQAARQIHGLPALPLGPFADKCGVQMIGLKTNALKFLIEQLPGTEACTRYTPKYHQNTTAPAYADCINQDQDELHVNIYGAARCEPFLKRSDYDLFSWLASKHRKQPKQIFVQPSETEQIARRCTANLPMAMKYRTLKESCKHTVGVFRSLIHGRGLFCTKDIEAGEMVIEYAGELIRSTLTDKRERMYDSRGIGCYMFKIDDNFVVDSTIRGNAARFINHSCEPNCFSKVVDILGHKHIIIFSLRRIVQGEELTYDYKFPFEDVKIPCSCGSKKCRKYLN